MTMNYFRKQQTSYWHCDNCDRVLLDGETRLNCTVCRDFDFCESCVKTVDPPHPHPMIPELAYGPTKTVEDVPSNMAAGILTAIDLYSNRRCLGIRDVDEANPSTYLNSYSWLTYETVGNRVKNFGHGLRSLVEPRTYLGICAANRPEWLITNLSCVLQCMISVPMYCLFTDREMTYVINNTQISIIVCDKQMLTRFIQIVEECPSLRHIVCMDSISEEISNGLNERMPSLHYMGDLEKFGSTKQYDRVDIKPDECLTIMYTSGSSGFPKGAIISEKAYRATFELWFISCIIERITFCYRPLAWAAARDAAVGTFISGGRTGFSSGDMSRLMEELALVRPTQLSAAPSFWNKIYSEYKTALSLINNNQSADMKAAEKERLLQEFSKLIPTRCTLLTVGSAKISPVVMNFMKKCFTHCRVEDSYGITECGSVAYSYNLEDILYRLESVPEMGYTVDDKPFPRGEILVKTSQMFSGYINNPEETRAALTEDGYFRTGDIIELRPNHYRSFDVHVIDRKKSFFKLAQGQFVSPEYLQCIYIRSPFVEQIYIHGDILANVVSAVIVPNRAYTQAFILEHGLQDFDTNNPDPQFCDAIRKDLCLLAKKESLRTYEIPSKIIVDFEPFSPENGLLTSSQKPCRHKLATHYGERLKTVNTIDQRLKTIIETAIGQPLSDDDEKDFLMTNGADSLTAVRLSRTIENDLGIPIPLNILFDPSMTLQQLTSIIKDPSLISSMSKSIVPQLLKDCLLDLNITPEKCKKIERSPSTVFVTGTTGFVGAFLLAELLIAYPSNCKFICLVRCKSDVDPLDRIRDKMRFYQLWKEDYQERVISLRGDLAKASFGLDNQVYESLANRIDLIFHCGAIVNFILPYSQLYDANVFGTREIIRLSTSTSHYIPIQYISTIGVLSSNVHIEISIDEMPPDNLISGYAQSKWVAEKLVNAAGKLGVPVAIYRLGSICAATNTGVCNENDIHTLLLAAIMKIGCYPETEMNSHFNGLPVDFTVKSIVYLSQIQSDINGKIYHVLNSDSNISLRDIIETILHCGIQLTEISLEQWQNKLKIESNQNKSFETVTDFLIHGDFNEECTISSEQFCTAVSPMIFPNLDKDFVFRWVNFIFHHIVH